MFRAIRLRLIAYVVGVLALVLLAAGVLVYVLLTKQLDAAIETQLRADLPPAPSPAMPSVSLPLPSPPAVSSDGRPAVVSIGSLVPPKAPPPPDVEAQAPGLAGIGVMA